MSLLRDSSPSSVDHFARFGSYDQPVIDTEVLVVGAGPAGSAAAIQLARAGVDVTVIDKMAFPRDKTCGDGLTTLALRLLQQLGLSSGTVDSWFDVDRVWMRAPSGREVQLRLPQGQGRYAAVTKRADLDAALVEVAVAAGATLIEGATLSTVCPGNEAITAHLADGSTITSRYIVAADGMWSPTRKALGLAVPGYRGDWHAARQYRSSDGERGRDLWIWFEPDLLPGYAWSFPLPNGLVNVGFGIVRSGSMSGRDFAHIWQDLFERPHIREVLGETENAGPHRAWPIPARLPSTTLTGPRTLFVGDAATATDPMTGEGVGQALETGMLAAAAIAEHRSSWPADVLNAYRREARQSLAADHRMATALSRVLGSRVATNAALRAVSATDWTRRNFARWMFEDYPRALVATPRRWQRGAMSKPGAEL